MEVRRSRKKKNIRKERGGWKGKRKKWGGIRRGRESMVVFLRSATKGLCPITTDNCDGMPALCALLPFPCLCIFASLPTSSSSSSTSTVSLAERTPGGAAQTKPSLQQSFAGKLFTKPPEAVRLPDTTKHARVSLPLTLPPVLVFVL